MKNLYEFNFISKKIVLLFIIGSTYTVGLGQTYSVEILVEKIYSEGFDNVNVRFYKDQYDDSNSFYPYINFSARNGQDYIANQTINTTINSPSFKLLISSYGEWNRGVLTIKSTLKTEPLEINLAHFPQGTYSEQKSLVTEHTIKILRHDYKMKVEVFFKIRYKPVPLKVSIFPPHPPSPTSPRKLCPNEEITLKATNEDSYSAITNTTGLSYKWQYYISPEDVPPPVQETACTQRCWSDYEEDMLENNNDYEEDYWGRYQRYQDCLSACPMVQTITWHDLATTPRPSCTFIPIHSILRTRDLSTATTEVFFRVKSTADIEGDYGQQSKSFIFEKYKTPVGLLEGVVLKPICKGGSDGSITVTTTGDTSGKCVFAIKKLPDGEESPGVGLQDASLSKTYNNLESGSYKITSIREGMESCSINSKEVMIAPGPRTPLSARDTFSTIRCYGGNSVVSVTATGGKGPYSYFNSRDNTRIQTPNEFNLPSGEHSILIQDNCPSLPPTIPPTTPTNRITVNFSIGSPSRITIDSITPSHCNSSNNATLTVSASGGTGALKYSLYQINGEVVRTLQDGHVFSNLTPGIYEVRVSNVHSCPPTTQRVTIPSPLSISSFSVTDPSCRNSEAEKGLLSNPAVSGGTPFLNNPDGSVATAPYYKWKVGTGAYVPIATALEVSPGAYTVTVKDRKGCTVSSSSTMNSRIQGTITYTPISCHNGTTNLQVTATGGTGTYSYSWSGNGRSGVTANLGSVRGSAIGTQYSVTITDGKCTSTSTTTILDPAPLSLSLSASQHNGVNIRCHGGNDGEITATASGGTAPYTYTWTNHPEGTVRWFDRRVSGISIGAGLHHRGYRISVTDAKDCPAVHEDITPSQPALVTFDLASDFVKCFGNSDGKITISNEEGGTGFKSFKYSYNNGAPITILNRIIPNLLQGTYRITATDRNLCSTTKSIEVIGPSAALAMAITAIRPSCNGGSNGQIILTASGGTPPYQYSQDNISFTSTDTFSGLPKGYYSFYVKDSNECRVWTQMAYYLPDPPALSFSTTVKTESCFGRQDGQIIVTAQGGRSGLLGTGYQYSLDQGDFGGSNIFNNLTARSSGSYYMVSVKDRNQCVVRKFIEVERQPALTATIEQPPDGIIKCKNNQTGKLNLTVTGGTPDYTYNWSNGATTQNLNSLPKGDYSVTVTDGRGCSITTDRYEIAEPSQLLVAETLSNHHTYNISCAGGSNGSITLSVTGGTPKADGTYNYLWNDGQVVSHITGLRALGYSVTVKDVNECQVAKQWTLSQPDTLKVGIKPASKIHLTCYGARDGSLLLRTSGGAGDDSFSKDGGVNYQTSPDFTGLSKGTYTIRAKDINDCVSWDNQKVDITQNSEIQILFTEIHQAECGHSNGYLVSSATGGIGPYTYRWTAEGKTDSELVNARLENVKAGQYPLIVTDHLGCAKSSSASVSNPEGPVFSVVDINATRCSYSNNGSAAISINSAEAPYTIRWSNGETGMTNSHLPYGNNNSVAITDGKYCETTREFSIGKPDEISLRSSTIVPPVCHLQSNATIEVEIRGGTSGYSFYWNNNLTAGTRSKTGVSAGMHSLKVVDANQCEAVFTLNVQDKPEVIVQEVFTQHINCFGGANGSIEVAAAGGNGGFTYRWNTDSTTTLLKGLSVVGDYSVTATDSRGCTGSKSITLTSPSQVMATLTKTDNLCRGDRKGQIQVVASGGVASYQYSKDTSKVWSNTATYNNLPDGERTIHVKDNRGCEGKSSIRIESPSMLSIREVTKQNPFCDLENGMAEVNVSGGTTPYNYEWRNSRGQLAGTQPVVSNCDAGDYNLKVRDTNLCLASFPVTFPVYVKPEFDVINVTPATCHDTKDASAALQIGSIQSPYTIRWSSAETTLQASKLSRGDSVRVIDSKSCSIKKLVPVPYTAPITILNETLEHPGCRGQNGLISLRAGGGTGEKKYYWNETLGTNTYTPVAGNYNLTIRDNNSCAFVKSYGIIDPPVFTIDIGPDQIVCPGTSLPVGVNIPGATYEWTGPNGFQSTQDIVTVSVPGDYRVEVLSRNGCSASDEMKLTVRENLLKADFLMTSKAYVRDTVEILDISMPIPQEVLWQPDEAAKVITRTADRMQAVFLSPGTYSVGLLASLSSCQDRRSQSILIIDRPDHDRQGARIAEDSPLSVYPNPFDQVLNVVVQLSDTSEALVEVLSFSHKGLLMSKTLLGEKEYILAFDFGDYGPGLYVVVLRYNNRIFKVKVIKR